MPAYPFSSLVLLAILVTLVTLVSATHEQCSTYNGPTCTSKPQSSNTHKKRFRLKPSFVLATLAQILIIIVFPSATRFLLLFHGIYWLFRWPPLRKIIFYLSVTFLTAKTGKRFFKTIPTRFRRRKNVQTGCILSITTRRVPALNRLLMSDIGGLPATRVTCRNVGATLGTMKKLRERLNRQWWWERSWRMGRDGIDLTHSVVSLGASAALGGGAIAFRAAMWEKRRKVLEEKIDLHDENLKRVKQQFVFADRQNDNSHGNGFRDLCPHCQGEEERTEIKAGQRRQGAVELVKETKKLTEHLDDAANDMEQVGEVLDAVGGEAGDAAEVIAEGAEVVQDVAGTMETLAQCAEFVLSLVL